MDWKRAIEEERAALGRIVALLCALADLAERAAGRSAVVRSLLLWFLRQAETVARDFVAGSPDTSFAPMPVVPAGDGPANAIRLAMSLRALARQIDAQARPLLAMFRKDSGEPEPLPSVRMPSLRDALASLSIHAAFAPAAPYLAHAPDTS